MQILNERIGVPGIKYRNRIDYDRFFFLLIGIVSSSIPIRVQYRYPRLVGTRNGTPHRMTVGLPTESPFFRVYVDIQVALLHTALDGNIGTVPV